MEDKVTYNDIVNAPFFKQLSKKKQGEMLFKLTLMELVDRSLDAQKKSE